MQVVCVSDPGAALSTLAQSGKDIALLLTDVVMPGMSGRDLAVQARQIRPNLPVIFMSGYAEAGPSVAELEMLGARFIQKPFTPDELESAVRAELHKYKPARIVIADDDGGVRAFLSSVLEGAGYSVIGAEDGAAAIQALTSVQADLLITDLVMPGQEGIETIRSVRQTWPDLRIVAISGAFYGQFLRTAEVLGAKAVLQKPIRPDDLLRAVREVLQQ
jgi:CheY-like chemotaxis protein